MNNNNRILPELGKLPPQVLELEEIVLGALMLERDSYGIVSDILKEEVFYKDAHQKIYKAICNLFKTNSPIDTATVATQLRSQGELESIGGAFYLTELSNRIASSANIEFHSRIIVEKFMMREVIRISSEGIARAYSDMTDCFELFDYYQSELYKITAATSGKHYVNAGDLVPERLEEYQKTPESGLTGIPTGIDALDELGSGWQKSDLVIIAARPSMGKTAFVLHCARHAAIRENTPVAFFSLEMSAKQLVDRIISGESNVSVSDINKRRLGVTEFTAMTRGANGIISSKILIDDTAGLTISQFRAKAIRMKKEEGVQMIIVDYLQLMEADSKKNSNREHDISQISRELKKVAKDLDVPVLALSQLSRAVESRPGGSRIPRLSDLRESGAIEQDADIVYFLYRPEYYGLDQDEAGNPTIGLCQVICEKHRNGELGVVDTKFTPSTMQFSDWKKNENNQFDVFKEVTLKPSTAFEIDNYYSQDDGDDVPF